MNNDDAPDAANEEVALALDLDVLPLLIQYHLSNEHFSPEHVAYQQMFQLMLTGLYGDDRKFPKHLVEHVRGFETLKSFLSTFQNKFGRASIDLLRGRGGTGGAPESPSEVFKRRNMGVFSVSTLAREKPQRTITPGVQSADLLNLFAALKRETAASWSPVLGKRSYLIVGSWDGAAIAAGLQTDEQRMCNVGLVGTEQTVLEAAMVSKMTEDEVSYEVLGRAGST
jgi:hypothetical protein